MDPTQFETALRQDGFTEVATKSQPPGHTAPEHAHPFDVRALVLEGEITLTVDGQGTAYRAGDVFVMEGGCRHSEAIGAEGARILSGRRHRPA
jgi:quercetin dioxygenase-like cupin family protein